MCFVEVLHSLIFTCMTAASCVIAGGILPSVGGYRILGISSLCFVGWKQRLTIPFSGDVLQGHAISSISYSARKTRCRLQLGNFAVAAESSLIRDESNVSWEGLIPSASEWNPERSTFLDVFFHLLAGPKTVQGSKTRKRDGGEEGMRWWARTMSEFVVCLYVLRILGREYSID